MFENGIKNEEEMIEVVVMGGGAAGMATALKLADEGYQVTLIEKNTLGSGASGNNPGRMGHGFHYADIPTALSYLRASIKVQRAHAGHLLGQDRPFSDPIRHGRYMITKNSTEPTETILATYEAIKEEYKRLVKEDPENEVFGPPETFFRILDPSEYHDEINADLVEMAVETCEHLFHWPSFLAETRIKIENHPNITLREHAEVTDIKKHIPLPDNDSKRYAIHYRQNDNDCIINTNFVVNSTWQNIETFNKKVGIPYTPGQRTNRLKVLLEVKLPENFGNKNSMFFCMGQHCMISMLADGRAMMTYARTTNLETSSDLTISERAERLINGGATEKEINKWAREILEGVSGYIPGIENAEIIGLRFGIVQTRGKLTLEDLQNPTHEFNRRDDHNVRSELVGWISNPCMKLFYFEDNAEIVSEMMNNQLNALAKLQQCFADICTELTNVHHISLSTSKRETIYASLEQIPAEKWLAIDMPSFIRKQVKTFAANQTPGNLTQKSLFGNNGDVVSADQSMPIIEEERKPGKPG